MCDYVSAAVGIGMTILSTAMTMAESAMEHQYDSQVINSNAAQAAWQHLVAAGQADSNSSFYNWQGSQANGSLNPLSAAGTILGGIGAGIGQYNTWSKVKTSGGKGDFTFFNTGTTSTPGWNTPKGPLGTYGIG